MENEKELRRVLDLARDEVIRLNQPRALEYLWSIRSQVDDLRDTSIWAEHQLLVAGAFAVTGDSVAEAEFEEALSRARNLPERDAGLEMRAYDDFAKFLASFEHRRSRARDYSEAARKLALERRLLEDAARLQLRIARIELEMDDDPRIGSFQSLKRAAKELGSSYQRQLAAWIQYCGENQQASRGRLAARKQDIASVEYFRHLLSSIR